MSDQRWRQPSPYFPDAQWPDWVERFRFYTMGLLGEVGELANIVKKEWRGDPGDWMPPMLEELAGVRIYLERLGAELRQSATLPPFEPLPGDRAALVDDVFDLGHVCGHLINYVLAAGDNLQPFRTELNLRVRRVYLAAEKIAADLGVDLDAVAAAEFERAEAKARARQAAGKTAA